MKILTQKIKRLFTSKKSSIDKPVIKLNTSFKEQMVNDIIPFVEKMIEKERNHLYWLESKKAPQSFIEKSKRYLNHFMQRHKEYIQYVNRLS